MTKENEISRLARITNIATMLKSKRILTATDIAKKFDISIRTVYRDIRPGKFRGSGNNYRRQGLFDHGWLYPVSPNVY